MVGDPSSPVYWRQSCEDGIIIYIWSLYPAAELAEAPCMLDVWETPIIQLLKWQWYVSIGFLLNEITRLLFQTCHKMGQCSYPVLSEHPKR